MGRYDIVNVDGAEDRALYINKTLGDLAPALAYSRPETDKELSDRIINYFQRCAAEGIVPVFEKMALYIGTDYATFRDWAAGKSLGTGPKCQEICKKAKEICSAFESQAALDNKINPVVYIYRSKAHYGYKDNPDVVLSVSTDQRSKEEILAEAKALEDI